MLRGERRLLLFEHGVERRLQQHVARLFLYHIVVVLVYGVDEFVRLFNHILLYSGVGLNPVPRATVGIA